MEKDSIEKNKRAEITSQQLVGIIILIVSFGVVLVLLLMLNLNETTQEEICHNSVVTAGNNPFVSSLDCKTKYLCISGGEECGGFAADETIKINPESKVELADVIAKEMATCWWMYGEGEVDYIGKGDNSRHCGVCRVFSFSEDLSEISLSYGELYSYMDTEEYVEGESYGKYLFGSYSDDVYSFSEGKQGGFIKINPEITIDPKERYVILNGFDRSWGSNNDAHMRSYLIKESEVEDAQCIYYDLIKA